MHRFIRAGVVLTLLGAVALAAGCSSSASASDSEGAPKMRVWGYVASEKNAQLEADTAQKGQDTLKIDRVLAPGPAWLVVHLDKDGVPGDRVGLLHVDKGRSSNLEIPLKNVTTQRVIVAVHADKGTEGKFDFDMMNKETSPDRPYFVDRKELAQVVSLVQ